MEDKNGQLSAVVSPENSEQKKSFWHINRETLPYKLQFFLFVGGAGAIFPFQAAFGIIVLGLTAGNIAACYTALQVSIMVLKPGIGYIVDYFNALKAGMVGLAVLQGILCFLMIIIPDAGMPGKHKMQLMETSQNKTYCQFCFNIETFNSFPPNHYLNEENLRQVSFCFNDNVLEYISINCSTENLQSTYFINDSYEIRQMTCNSSHTDSLWPEYNTTSEDLYAGKDFSHILHLKSSQMSFVCILPTGKNFFSMNVSSDDINQYCYALSSKTALKLQELFLESGFTTLDCKNLHKRISLPKKDEPSLSIANFKTYQFWAFAVCLIFSCTFGSSQFTMSDTACYESIHGIDYGQQRVWGAISWGMMAPLAGYLNDYTESYMAAWCLYVGLTALQIINLSRMNLVKPDFSLNILKDLKIILSSMEFLCFEIGVLMNGMFTGIIWYYLTWFIVSIGGNKLIIGLVHMIQCYFGEVPAIYFSTWLINRFGHFNLVSLALIIHGIRFFFYSYLHDPWWILPIECLQGLTFGSFYAAMTSYAKLSSKPGTEATTQSILTTTFEGLGCGLGCLITGLCLEYFGGHNTFFYASFLCVIATMINVFFTFLLKDRKGTFFVSDSTASVKRY